MPRLPLPPLALAALLLAVPQATAAPDVRVSPADAGPLLLHGDATVETSVTVENLGDEAWTGLFRALPDGPLIIEPADAVPLTLAPGAGTIIAVRARLADAESPRALAGIHVTAGDATTRIDVSILGPEASRAPLASGGSLPGFRPLPAGVRAATGASFHGEVIVPNPTDSPVHVELRAHGLAHVRFSQATVEVAPREEARVDIEVILPRDASGGERWLRFEAWLVNGSSLAPFEIAMQRILVPDDAVAPFDEGPARPPYLGFSSISASLGPGLPLPVAVQVTNPTDAPMRVPLRVDGVPGWDLRLEPAELDLAPGETSSFTLHRTAAEGAQSGTGALYAGEGLVVAYAELGLTVLRAPAAPAGPVVSAVGRAAATFSAIPGPALVLASVGVLAAGVAVARRAWPLAFAGMYARIARSRLLDHPTRARLRALVEERPGITHNELMRATGLGAGTLQHHARRLEAAGALLTVEDGQRRRYYAPGAQVPEARGALDARIIHLVARAGRARPAALATALGVSRQAAHYHVKRLVASGELVAEREGRLVRVRRPEL